MSNRKIIDVAEAWATDYSHESLANKLAIQHHYCSEQMEFETPCGDDGEPDYSRVRVIVYSE